MAKVATKGLARAKEIYENRDSRAREVRKEGKKVFGYMCVYPVLEMLTAADIVPYRIFGNMREPITEADNYLNALGCPFARSCFEMAIKGKYDFFDGTAWAHTCDFAAYLHQPWKTIIKTPNPNFINQPHQTHQPAIERYKLLLGDFQTSLENFTGKKITRAKLKKAINLHNQQRALAQQLYDLRKSDPPLISGVETLLTTKAVMSLPIEEGIQLLQETIDEVKSRKNGLKKKPARLLVWGPVIDDTAFIELMENLDANVVMDDMCVGSRAFFPEVEVTDDPLDGLTQHYQVDLKCPFMLRDSVYGEFRHDYTTDIANRYKYLGEYVKGWNVNGVILQAPVFCDSHAFEIPDIKEYLNRLNIPSLYLEHDYSEASLAPMRTRIEGFLEVIAQKK